MEVALYLIPVTLGDTVIEKVMLWYKENGYAKERLGAAIDRLGADALERGIATDDLIERREEILSRPVL